MQKNKELKIYNCISYLISMTAERSPRERSGFDPRSQQTWVVKPGSDSSTAKRSAIDVSVLISLLKPRAIAHVSNEAHSPFVLGFQYWLKYMHVYKYMYTYKGQIAGRW